MSSPPPLSPTLAGCLPSWLAGCLAACLSGFGDEHHAFGLVHFLFLRVVLVSFRFVYFVVFFLCSILRCTYQAHAWRHADAISPANETRSSVVGVRLMLVALCSVSGSSSFPPSSATSNFATDGERDTLARGTSESACGTVSHHAFHLPYRLFFSSFQLFTGACTAIVKI